MSLRLVITCALLSAFFSISLPIPAAFAKEGGATKEDSAAPTIHKANSVVRVNSTCQPYDFLRPWSKRPPFQRHGIGAVLLNSRVLVTAEMVVNSTYIEFEKPDSGEKCPAVIELLDYECDLAVLKPSQPDFLKPFKPLAITEPNIGDDFAVWQLESNGSLLSTKALFTTAEVGSYPIGNSSFLVYRATCPLQHRDSSFTMPVVKGGALAGVLFQFDSSSQTANIIPAPIIQHFLKAAEAKGGYVGFPRSGISTASMRDPQLRRYAGLTNGNDGVYITDVRPGGPADKAGIQKGDVLLAVGKTPVDRDENYVDPRYGKLSMSHIISCGHYDGEKLPFKLMRQGKEFTVEVTLEHPDATKSIIEPYTIDVPPKYYIIGGLVFQELSRQFLREWGQEWYRKAPERFLYYDAYQDELFRNDPRKRIVILSNVLPSPCTVGYEELRYLVVTGINGVSLNSLSDIEDALSKPVDGFHHIQFEGHPGEIVIDAKEASALQPKLMRNYGLPAIKRL